MFQGQIPTFVHYVMNARGRGTGDKVQLSAGVPKYEPTTKDKMFSGTHKKAEKKRMSYKSHARVFSANGVIRWRLLLQTTIKMKSSHSQPKCTRLLYIVLSITMKILGEIKK